jgi:dihydroorotate dehydrogenase electron transfer subunit
MYPQNLVPVVRSKVLQNKIARLTFCSGVISQKAEPGNFVHLRVSQGYYPLLRRAFSIHQTDPRKGQFDILFKVVGPGTEMLSKKRPGDPLDALGPLGNGFSLPGEDRKVMLVAGGMGIAPLWFLLLRLVEKHQPSGLTFFLGARSRDELVYPEELGRSGVRLVMATDDGSAGHEGLVTEVFLKEIQNQSVDFGKLAVYSCGPPLMLKRMAQIARKFDFSCQVSLENHMACGVGVCWGCAVKQADGTYKRVCADGPVFGTRELASD